MEPLVEDPSLSKKVEHETCEETNPMRCLPHTFADLLSKNELEANDFRNWDTLETTVMTADNNIIYLDKTGD